MKRFCVLLLMSLLLVPASFAQKEDSKENKKYKEFLEVKMKYLADEMDLNDSQRKKFYELYEEMSFKKMECYTSVRTLEKKLKKLGKDAPEGEYQKVTEAKDKANLESAEIEKQYNAKFSEFLSQKQIYNLKEAETSFKAKLEEMRHNKKKSSEKSKDHKHQEYQKK